MKTEIIFLNESLTWTTLALFYMCMSPCWAEWLDNLVWKGHLALKKTKLDWPSHSPFLPSLTCSSWTVPRHVRMKISTCFWLCIICSRAHLCNKSCTRSRAFTHSKTTSQWEGPFPYKSPTHWSIADSSAEQAVGNVFVFTEPSIWLTVKYTLSHILSCVDTQHC